MTITYLYTTHLTVENATGRRHPHTYTKKTAIECGERIIACIIVIRKAVRFVRRKIIGGRLRIIPVKRRNGKEWAHFKRNFYIRRM